MRQREQTQTSESNLSTAGIARFQIAGYVQEVKRNEKMKCDYVRFYITSKVKPEYYDIIAVNVPDAVGVCCENGDCIVINGFIRSWNRNGAFSLEMVAERVAQIAPEQLEGLNNGKKA